MAKGIFMVYDGSALRLLARARNVFAGTSK